MKSKHYDYLVVQPDPENCAHKRIDLEEAPLVSFCIPTLNNEVTLGDCLESIVNQDYPRKEIVVVDGGSTDDSVRIARKYTNKVLFDDGLLGSARQTSIEHSSGEILALFDSDIIIPHPKWLVNSLRYFNCGDNVGTVWPFNVAPPRSPPLTRLYFNHWMEVMKDRIRKNRSVFGGGNSLFLAKAMKDIGGISREIHWGEDFDWALRLRAQGYQVVIIDDPLYHDTMRSIKEFTKKQFIGSDTFTKKGFQLMGLSFNDVVYEQFILGAKGLVKGVFYDRDFIWLLFPPLVLIRTIAYGKGFLSHWLGERR